MAKTGRKREKEAESVKLGKSGKSGKNWQKLAKVAKVTKVAEVEKSGKKWLWFDQIQITHKPSAGASRWLTVRSANPPKSGKK